MHSSGKILVSLALYFFGSLLFGCVSSSNLVDTWHDATFKTQPLGKILVIAVKKDATKRRIWEDAFTGGLSKHGVAATASYQLFPDVPPDTDQVNSAVKAHGFDGILVILKLPTEINKSYVEGYTTTVQKVSYNPEYSSFNGPYWERYQTYYREIDHSGYVDSQSVARREIDVTTTGTNGRLIWSTTSRTPDPGVVVDVQNDIVDLVISQLDKQKIIKTVP